MTGVRRLGITLNVAAAQVPDLKAAAVVAWRQRLDRGLALDELAAGIPVLAAMNSMSSGLSHMGPMICAAAKALVTAQGDAEEAVAMVKLVSRKAHAPALHSSQSARQAIPRIRR